MVEVCIHLYIVYVCSESYPRKWDSRNRVSAAINAAQQFQIVAVQRVQRHTDLTHQF